MSMFIIVSFYGGITHFISSIVPEVNFLDFLSKSSYLAGLLEISIIILYFLEFFF